MRRSMSKEEFLRTGAIFAEQIRDAFDTYESAVLVTDNKSCMIDFLECVLRENEEHAYADYYYPALDAEQQSAFLSGLSEEERMEAAQFEMKPGQVFYPVDAKGIAFLLEITARNWLFSTFYFTNKKLTIWGNYDLEFPIFCEDTFTLEHYILLAKKCGLELKE